MTLKKYFEKVLVVPAKKLYQKGKWNGFRSTRLDWYRQLVNQSGKFYLRDEVENDPTYKQVIPQIIFCHQGKIFLHRIRKSGSEARIHGMYPIFLGGHVNPVDVNSGGDLLDTAAKREFIEEANYSGGFVRQKFVGLVNQLEGSVNQVHVGFVYIYEGNSPTIFSNEKEVTEVGLLTIKELKPYVKSMTYWSQLIFPHLTDLIK